LEEIVVRGHRVVLRDLRFLSRTFVVAEEEQPIPHKRSTKRAAELIAAYVGFGETFTLVEKRVRPSGVGAVEAKQVAAEPVRPCRRDHLHSCRAAGGRRAWKRRRDRELADGV